uniref:RNA polymerase subunit n=1 Tax=Siphoviridae sp. ctnFo11 TaxID=2826454 RepID=A0A8S5N4N1_9CAUD|nr:MAG TPA: RNA polymerase subunit [Siphoviridae sp. ctnFo11]
MMKCRECGKMLPQEQIIDICLDCSRKNMQKLFRDDPELKDAFRETIEELRKPENVKKMVDGACRVVNAINKMRDGR